MIIPVKALFFILLFDFFMPTFYMTSTSNEAMKYWTKKSIIIIVINKGETVLRPDLFIITNISTK